MKKIRFVFAALAMFALASSVNSCSKEKNIEPTTKKVVIVDSLANQATYTVKSLTYNNYEMKPIVSGQLNSNDPSPVLIEVSVNELNADITQQRTSTMRAERYGQPQTIKFVKIDDDKCSLSFIGNFEMHAGENNQNSQNVIPQSLLQLQVFDWHYADNGNYSWLTFNTTKLSGIYTVEEVKTGNLTTGFTLTYQESTNKTIVMTLEKKLY